MKDALIGCGNCSKIDDTTKCSMCSKEQITLLSQALIMDEIDDEYKDDYSYYSNYDNNHTFLTNRKIVKPKHHTSWLIIGMIFIPIILISAMIFTMIAYR